MKKLLQRTGLLKALQCIAAGKRLIKAYTDQGQGGIERQANNNQSQ